MRNINYDIIFAPVINNPKNKTMKTILLCTLFSLLSVITFGQLADSSASFKIEYAGSTATQAIVKATNYQSCNADYKFTYNGNDIFKNIPSGQSALIYITVSNQPNQLIKAKPLSNCGGGSMGVLQIIIDGTAGAALPVKWISVSATGVSNGVRLDWITEEEQVSHFNIQESNDGLSWSFTAKVNAGPKQYSFTDNTPSTYYRIASVDLNGSVTLSKVLKIVLYEQPVLAVYPNPAISTVTVSLKSNQVRQISLFSLSGMKLKQIDTKGMNSLKIDLNGLSAGVYVITDGINQIKFNKQ